MQAPQGGRTLMQASKRYTFVRYTFIHFNTKRRNILLGKVIKGIVVMAVIMEKLTILTSESYHRDRAVATNCSATICIYLNKFISTTHCK